VPKVRYVDANTIRLERRAGSVHLRAHLDDLCVLNAKLKSGFPLSSPSRLTSLLDGAGDEVAILRNPVDLDSNSKKLLEEELDRRYFTPRLNTLLRVKFEAGMWHFVADSQRGEVDFFVRNWRDNAQEIAPGRWQINSVDGARYEIPNLEALDAESRKLMDQLL
jgi:hypothetical protein